MTTILFSGMPESSRIDHVLLVDAQVTELASDAGVGEHRAPGDDDLATASLGGIADLLQTMDMAGEGRDEHAALGILDRIVERVTDLGLGLGEARNDGVSRVGQEQVDADLGEAGDGAVIGGDAVDGGLVQLEVTGVHDIALRGLDEDAERAGDGMGHREEVDLDAAEVHMAAALDLAELGSADAELGELALDEAEGELA